MLLEVEEERKIPKSGRNIILQTIKIGDPVSKMIVEVKIWERNVKINKEFLNKTVLLKNFKITKYEGKFYLSSCFSSDIVKHKYFKEFERKWKPIIKYN